MKIALLLLSLALMAVAQTATTTYGGRKAWIIKRAGTTTVTTRLGGEDLKVSIHTWQAPVDDSGAAHAPRPYTQCTYSQNPCSITDWIQVRLGGKDLWIGPYDIAGLGDMHYLSVSGTSSRLVLLIGGGDGADGYDARLIFDRQQLVERVLYGLDPEHPFEVSHFYYEAIN